MAGGASGPSGSKSAVKIAANILIAFIGSGVLGLPFAFKEAGILEGTLIMIVVGVVSVKAMFLIIDCKYKLIGKQEVQRNSDNKLIVKVAEGSTEEKTEMLAMENGSSISKEEPMIPQAPGQELGYGDVGYYAMGHTGQLLVDVSILISQIGFCCAYLIFISENLADFTNQSVKIWEWLLMLLPLLYLLTLLRHLSSLALSSVFAQMSNVMAFAVVFWFDFEHFGKIKIHPKEVSLRGFPFFLSIAIYCYEGAGMILSLESSLHKDVRSHFKFYFKTSMIVVTTLYIAFGVCGYLSFGPETNAIITLNLPKGSSLDFAMMVKTCLCLSLFFTYPVMMFPVMRIIEKRLVPSAAESVWKGNLIRFLVTSLTGMVVMAIPSFANLMALVGASCCTLLAFILPGTFHLLIFKGYSTKWQKFVDIFIISLGVVGAIIGTLDAFKRMGGHTTGEVLQPTLSNNISLPSVLPTSNVLSSSTAHLVKTSLNVIKTVVSSTATAIVNANKTSG